MPGFKNNAANVVGEARKAMAKNLLAAAVFFTNQHQQRLGAKTAPPASRPGEYPAKRTGFLQASVLWNPASPNEVEQSLRIRVGYLNNAFYGPILEFQKHRLGLKKTLEDLEPQLSALAGGEFKTTP